MRKISKAREDCAARELSERFSPYEMSVPNTVVVPSALIQQAVTRLRQLNHPEEAETLERSASVFVEQQGTTRVHVGALASASYALRWRKDSNAENRAVIPVDRQRRLTRYYDVLRRIGHGEIVMAIDQILNAPIKRWEDR